MASETQDGSTLTTSVAGNMEERYHERRKWRNINKVYKGNNQQFNRPRHEREEKFPGRKSVPEEQLKKYNYGPELNWPNLSGTSAPHKRRKVQQREDDVRAGRVETARAELLLTEQSGCMEAADGFSTTSVNQSQILQAADITTRCKSFDLTLDEFGPYRFRYFRDGRQLVLGGKQGHLACFNWLTKKLNTEINIMEEIHDVAWLQDHKAFAVAQKKWTSVYDDDGVEIHCIKHFHEINKLDYLPYHFLLAGMGVNGLLHYLDVSLGKEVLAINTKRLSTGLMVHNPYNGVVTTGHSGGTVSMWTPNSDEAVATVLCHKSPLIAITYDPAGRHLVTASVDREIRVWDARNLGEQLHSNKVRSNIRDIAISQTGLLAVASFRSVQVYRGIHGSGLSVYMNHRTDAVVDQLQFCPFEDVLGVSTRRGFSSIIIPGCGEANFDAKEANPYSSHSGQREALVKGLLAKIPSQLITLDPITVSQIDVPTLEEKLQAQRDLKYINVPRINPTPRYRMKGKSGSANLAKRKQMRKDTLKDRFLEKAINKRKDAGLEEEVEKNTDKHKEKLHDNILDRFK